MESILKFFKKDKEKKSLKTVLLKKTGSDENLIFKENLLDKLPLPLILIDSKRNIITFNETASFKFSLKKNTNLLYCIRIPSFREKIQQAIKSKKETKFNFEYPDGSKFKYFTADIYPTQIYREPILNYPFKDGFIISLVDTSEVNKLEKLKTEFIGNISHQLKTPLAIMLGVIETLQFQKLNNKEKKNYLNILSYETKKMNNIVRDLLQLSSLEISEHINPKDKVNISEIINTVVSTFKLKAKKKKIKINFYKKNKILLINGDEKQLELLFENLIDNSIKYANSNSKIIINLDINRMEKVLTVEIKDQSPGIAQKYISRLTERFYRIEEGRKTKIEGTGLGLAIVKHIANRHKTKLHIESILNKGSSFKLTFPLIDNKSNLLL